MTCRAPTASQTCAGTPTGATLTYDNEGRLATWQNTPSSPTTTDSFLYDGEGNRIEQVVQQSGVGTTDTVYVGGLEEVTTTTPSGGQPTTSVTAYYGGLALSVNGVLSYLVSDGLGSAEEALTTSGTVSASRLYTPYGSSRYSSGTFPTDQGFTGYLADSATGLDYANARYYDPAAGQFGSADPTSGSGFNRFGYVGGSPETATDPSGLELMVGDPQNGAGPATAIPGAALAGMVALVILFFEGVSKRVVNSYQAITTKPSITAPTEQVGGVTDTVNGPTIQADRNAAQAAAAAAVVGGVTDVVNGPLLQALRLANTPTTPTTPTPTPTPSTPTVTPATTEEPVAQPATSGAGATAGGGNGCSGGGGDGGSNATDTTRTYVIGEDMKNRVIPYAQARGYYYWKIRANATTDGMTRDQRWIWWLMRQGYRIVDIGRAPDRLAQGLPGSKYYDMELNTIARGNYGNFYRDKNPGC